MLGDVGIIVAAYTFTRLVNMLGRPETGPLTRALAVTSLVVIAICAADIIMKSMTGAGSNPR